jgi:predicted RNase H-like HicB family nuclease
MEDYHINIYYSNKDGGYFADIPDLEKCTAFGLSPIIALHEVLILKDLWLKLAKSEGRNIPKPAYKPSIYELMD